jgi:hypothetical protein
MCESSALLHLVRLNLAMTRQPALLPPAGSSSASSWMRCSRKMVKQYARGRKRMCNACVQVQSVLKTRRPLCARGYPRTQQCKPLSELTGQLCRHVADKCQENVRQHSNVCLNNMRTTQQAVAYAGQ